MHNLRLSSGFLNTTVPLCFSEQPALVYFRGLISPQSPDSRSAATAEVEPANRRWNIDGPLVLWLKEFWQRWRISQIEAKQRGWCVLPSVVGLHAEVREVIHSFSAKLRMPSRASWMDQWISISFLWLLAFLFFQRQSLLAFPPSLRSVPSFPTRDQISLPPPCHFCTTFIATDSWPPPRNSAGHNKVMTRSTGPH